MNTHALVLLAASLTAAAPAQTPYGNATPGSGGAVPRIAALGSWIGNGGFEFAIENGLGGSFAWALVSAATASLPVAGIELALDPAGYAGESVVALAGSGAGRAPLPLPASLPNAFLGLPFYAQAVVLDPGGPQGLAASRGVRFELGRAPLIFVGCSIGSNDPFQLVDPATQAIVDSGSPAQVDNTTAAVFGRGGSRLFVASSIRGTIGMADVSALPATWQTIFAGGGSCYGLALDAVRDRLWTLTDPGTGGRELTAIDVDEASPMFGQVVANTNGLFTGLYERWGLSPDGRIAVMLTLLPSTAYVIDTDPASPTYLQALGSALPIPSNAGGGIVLANAVTITPDNRYALIIVQNQGATPGEIARLDLQTLSWIDHNPSLPGIQNMGQASSPVVGIGAAPTTLQLNQTGSVAIACGFNGCGWLGRIEMDPEDPSVFSYVAYNPSVPLSNAWAAALSPDESEIAVATWPSNGCPVATAPELHRFDAVSGTLLGTVPIPFNNGSTTLQNLYTVVYR